MGRALAFVILIVALEVFASEPCLTETQNFCQGLSGPAMMACLKEHFENLAPKCQRAVDSKPKPPAKANPKPDPKVQKIK